MTLRLCCAMLGLIPALLLRPPSATAAGGDVAVFDRVGTLGTEATLVVRTTRFFVADGGRRVSVFLEGERQGDLLTGADGYGYLRVPARRKGLLTILARRAGGEASGRLLVVEKGEPVVLLEAEALMQRVLAGPGEQDACRASLESLARRYPLIFAYRFIGAGFWRGRLEAGGWPPAVVLPWRGTATLEDLAGKGVRVHAVVGSAETLAAAGDRVPHRFGFEKARGGIRVSDCSEIEKRLE